MRYVSLKVGLNSQVLKLKSLFYPVTFVKIYVK